MIGPQYPDSFADNVRVALSGMGHHAVALGSPTPRPRRRILARSVTLGRMVDPIDRKLQRSWIRRRGQARFDAVISLDSTLLPETVEQLQRRATPVALWFPDAVSNLDRQLMYIAPYRAVFFKDPALVARSRLPLGDRVHYLPEACNPAWHTPPSSLVREPVVVVAGNLYPFRVRFLQRVMAAGLPLRIFGPPPSPRIPLGSLAPAITGRYIAREEKARVFREAAVVLNSLGPAEMEGMNCRLFEAAGCGATILTEQRGELHKLFEVGDEVAAFSDFDELIEQAESLLACSSAGRAMGDRAKERAHSEHTYAHRLTKLLEIL